MAQYRQQETQRPNVTTEAANGQSADGQSEEQLAPATVSPRRLRKVIQSLWLVGGVLEALIGFRVLLKLMAANPNSGFAQFIYNVTDVFLAPFFGLTATPAANGAVLEIPAIIAMLVYALLFWLIERVIVLLLR